MPIVYLAPDPVQSTFFIPGGNTPGNGVQLFCYVAGSVSTKQNMYKDNTGTTTYSNPLVLDSGGNIPNGGVIWIPQGLPAKFVWAPSNDADPPNSPYRTIDNVSGINDTTTQEWILGPTPTFVNASSFTMAGDQTGTFNKGRRLKFAVTAGTVYGAVGAAVFATSTTVNPVFSTGSLDAGLTAVSYSLVGVDPSSINDYYIHKKATAVPSAGNGTTNIWGTDGDLVHVTGTNTIFHFSSAPYAGAERTVIFDGALSINTSAALSVPGGNVTTTANDRAEVKADTVSTHIITFYQNARGKQIVSPVASTGMFITSDIYSVTVSSMAASQADQKTASSNAVIVTPKQQHSHPSSHKASAKWDSGGSLVSGYNASVAKNGTGDYTVTFSSTIFSTSSFVAVSNAQDNAGSLVASISATTVSTCRLVFRNAAGTLTDSTFFYAAFFGDQ